MSVKILNEVRYMKNLCHDIYKKTYEKIHNLAIAERISTSISDNQSYPQVCIGASLNYRLFNKFRRNPVYNQVLEHVSKQQGEEYLRIISKDPDVFNVLDEFRANDNYGRPIQSEYPDIGKISPTTLRYVKVLSDIKNYVSPKLDGMNLCEIGVGYGGQCRVINAYSKPSSYCLVDIDPALRLAQRFLDNYALNSVVTYKTMNELNKKNYDLVISNYAFTELPRAIQDVYLQKIILSSKRGYITYNEITPDAFNSYKADELVALIPGAKIIKEEPLTYPKNCIIIWGMDS